MTMKCSFVLFCVTLLLLYDTDKTSASGPPTCNLGCKKHGGGDLLRLTEGVTYVYNLDGVTETLVPKSKGPDGESVKLGLKAKVHVSALPQCQVLIKLDDVHVTGPDTKKYGNLAKLEEFPLVVNLRDGKLEPEVCADPHDDYTSLNIKRAVASMLQADTKDKGGFKEEVDVFGGCRTNFRVTKDNDYTVIKKRKDLNDCKLREGLRQEFFATAHGHHSKFQSTPLMDADYEVEQRVKNGVVEVATARESYLFRPFANRDNGAKTIVHTKMILESAASGPQPTFTNSQPRSIIFENPHEVVTSNAQSVLSALHRLDDSLHGSVPPTAAKDFGTLVKLVRHTSKDDLLNIYGNARAGAGFKNKDVVRKVFVDALFRARSADSVAVAVELLRNHEIEGHMAKLWYLSFAFVRHTSASALASAAGLLDESNLPYEAYYGIGAMAGQYCREHVCEKVPEFEKLLSRMSKLVSNPTRGNKDKENTVIAVLKGLKNVKHLTDEAANKIGNIIKDVNVQTRVRVAALETAQTDACRGKIQRAANEVFANREEDSELRIKAYLVLVECPTQKTAAKLSEFLETEPVNQVGTFITSHLRNLRAGSNPDKELAREILYNVKPSKKFPIDYRKFSHNYDFSYNLDAISTSAAAESNIIFSQKSYLPRSVSLNLTTEIFGHAFNLFELNGRAENLDRIVEKYFGPKGYFKTHKPEELYKEGKHTVETLMNHMQEKYKSMVRHRRSVTREQTDHFASKVKLYNSEMDNTLDVDLSLKVLGNELWWMNLDERDEVHTPASIMDKISALYDREVKNKKEFSHDFKEHFQILDSELAYPTATGLPLRLRAVGSGVFHMKLAGRFDLEAFLKNPRNADAHLEVIPSASVDVYGEMIVDAYAVEAGVKVSANLHTATGSDVTVQLLDGHGFDLNFKLPVKNSDVLTASTSVVSTVKERGQPEVDHPLEFQVSRSDYSGCFDQLNQFVGVTFCGEVGFPLDKEPLISNAALFPLNGNSKVSLRFAKEDESLQSYQLRLYFNIDDPNSKTLELKFDTPGSQTPREISLKAAAVMHPHKAISVDLISPIHRASLRGEMIESDSEYSVSGSFVMNDAIEYRAKVGLLIQGSTYRPILEYTPVGDKSVNVKVDGTVDVEKKPGSEFRRYKFNNVRFIVENKDSLTVDGTITRDKGLIASDLRVGCKDQTVGLRSKFHQLAPGNYKMHAEVNPSAYPDFAFSLKLDHQRDKNHFENNVEFVHGPDLNSQEKKLSIFQQLHYRIESLTNFDVSTKNSISYPAVHLEGQFDGAVTRKSLSYNFGLGYDNHKFRSRLNAKTAINHVGDYEVDFYAAAFNRELSLEAKRDVVDAHKSKYYNKLEVSPGKKYELTADATHQLTPNNIHVAVVAVARIHNLPNEYRLDLSVISNPSVYDLNSVVAVGPDEVLNGKLHIAKSADPSGNFKLTLPKFLDSHGEYALSQGRGTGSFVVHIPELHRKIQGSADLTHNGPHHVGVVDILYDAERDVNKKLHVETDTQLTRTSVNSKNNVQLDGRHVQVNFNGDVHGKATNGAANGGYELTLPDGQYFVGKFKEALQVLPQGSHAELAFEMGRAEKQGAPLARVYLATFAKNVDMRTYGGQFKFEAGRECHEGNIAYSSSLTSVPHDGRLVIDADSSVTGSVVKHPFNSKTHAVASKSEVTFDTTSTYGEYAVQSRGKILTGVDESGVRHVDYVTDIKTPLDAAQSVKIEHLCEYVPGHGTKPHSMKFSQKMLLNNKPYDFEVQAELAPKHGFVRSRSLLPSYSKPSTADLQYKHERSGDKNIAEITYAGAYQDQNANLRFIAEYDKELEHVNGHLTGHLPIKALDQIDVKVDHRRTAPTSRNTDFALVVNGDKLDGYVKYDYSPHHPLFDVSYAQSAGTSRFYIKLDRHSDRSANSEGQVVWVTNGGGQLDFSSKIDLESFDNFHVLVKANSEKLNIRNYKLEVVNKPSKSGAAKKINVVVQRDEKAGISGTVSYKVKSNDGGFVVEGKGHIEIDGEKLPLTYKATYKRLSSSEDHEMGTSFALNANFNKGSVVLENKLTNKEFHYNAKYCKDSNCAHMEVGSKFELSELLDFNQDTSASYENTLGGRNYNYKVYCRTSRKGLVLDQEAGFVNRDRRYHVKSYIHENEGAVIVVLPSREIAAVANYEIPVFSKSQSDNKNMLRFHFDGSLYMDKTRNPGERANLLVAGDFTTHPRSVSTNGEIKFSHPRLHKDLVVRTSAAVGMEKRLVDASFEVDVSNKKNQKITGSVTLDHAQNGKAHNITGAVELVSKGLHIDVGASGHAFCNQMEFSAGAFAYYTDKQNVKKEMGAFAEASQTRFFTIVKLPNRELLKIDSRFQIDGKHQVIETDLSLAEKMFYVGKVDVQGWNTAKASLHKRDNPSERIEGNLVVRPSELMVRADHHEGPNQNDLVVLHLKLNEGEAPHSGFKYNSAHIQHFLDKVKAEKDHFVSEAKPFVKEIVQEVHNDLKDSLEGFRKAQPDYKPLMQAYQTEFDAIINELNEDPEFKMVADVVQKLVRGLVKVAQMQMERFIAVNEKISAEMHELQEKLFEIYQKILPSLTEAFERIVETWTQTGSEILNYVYQLMSHALRFAKEYEPEIRKFAEHLGIYFRDLVKAVSELTETLKVEAEALYNRAVKEMKDLPIYAELERTAKELMNFEIPPQFWGFYEEIVFAIEDVLPTIELKELAKTVFAYVEKKLKRQDVDDAAEVRHIVEKATTALKSVVGDVREQYLAGRPAGLFGLGLPVTIPSIVFSIPEIGSIGDSSLVRYIKSITELPSIADIFFTYRPTLNPVDYIPPYDAYGSVLRSRHFFTFDKRHFAFDGSCSYILAQDFLDGNFSLVANLENGHLKSLTLSDKTDTVEMFSDNTVSVNGKLGDYPFDVNDMSGWIRYGAINVNHKAGVKIRKIIKQDVYTVKVSGFYFWRTRGLLGTINNEQYDEFLLPDGHIARDASEFVNAYKVVDSCPNAAAIPPPTERSPECDKFFGGSSTLKLGFHFVDPEPYREACEQRVAAAPGDKTEAACDVVAAYVLALKKADYLLASLPFECAKCSVAGNPVEYGHSVPVNSPAGKADVVFVVEQSSMNEQVFNELIQPLMGSLASDLAANGLPDVEYALIGYGGPKQNWPRIYGNNGKKTFHGNAEKIVFGDSDKLRPPYDSWEKKFRFFLHYLSVELGREQIVTAMNEANIYPFRQGAAKVIILVNTSPCEKSATYPFSLQIPRTFTIRNYYKEHGLNFHIITPIPTVSVGNNPNDRLKNVAGFDSEHVYTVDGAQYDRKDLDHFDDLCISFSQYYGGAAFSSQNFVEGSPEDKHKFVDIVSKRVAKGAVEYDYTEECTCNLYHGVFSYPECKVTNQVKRP